MFFILVCVFIHLDIKLHPFKGSLWHFNTFYTNLKSYVLKQLLDTSIEMEYLVSDESPYFLITPVKVYVQPILLVKVISENVAKVHHVWVMDRFNVNFDISN